MIKKWRCCLRSIPDIFARKLHTQILPWPWCWEDRSLLPCWLAIRHKNRREYFRLSGGYWSRVPSWHRRRIGWLSTRPWWLPPWNLNFNHRWWNYPGTKSGWLWWCDGLAVRTLRSWPRYLLLFPPVASLIELPLHHPTTLAGGNPGKIEWIYCQKLRICWGNDFLSFLTKRDLFLCSVDGHHMLQFWSIC